MKTLFAIFLALSFTSCLKIYQDTRYIDATTPITSSTWKDYIKSIIEACTSYMNKVVTRRINLNSEVNPSTIAWKLDYIGSEEYDWPLGGIGSEFDFFVSFRPQLFPNETVAETFICQRTASNAPTIANIYLSRAKITEPGPSWPVSRIAMEREKHIYTVLHELVRSRFYNRRWFFWKDPKWISTLPKPSCTMGFGWEKLLYVSSPFNSRRVRTRFSWLSEQ